MPNRIIKESICTSEEIDRLTPFQEIFFYRLMVNCDDFGRFDARPKILKSRLFPLRDVTEEEIVDAVKALMDADLITVYYADGKPYLHMKTWELHQQTRAAKSKYPSPDEGQPQPDSCGFGQMISDDINGNQTISDDSKCPRNRIRYTYSNNDNRNRESRAMIADDDAHQISGEQNRVLDAAEDAGFMKSNSVRARLIGLYADHGLQKMLDAIASCVQHGAPNLAYLEAVLRGEPKKKKGRVLPADNFEQRDYSDVPDEMMRDVARQVAEMKAAEMKAGVG